MMEESGEIKEQENLEKELFFQIKKLSKSKEAPAQRVTAILTAVTSVIQERGGPLIPTSYFAVLLTSLTENQNSDIEFLASTLLLFSLVIPKVAPAVIRSRFADITQVLGQLYEKHNKTSVKAFLKALLQCLGAFLLKLDGSMWSQTEVHRFLQLVLSFSIDGRIKLRKLAQNTLGELFSKPDESKVLNKLTTPFLQQCLTSQEFLAEKDYHTILNILDLLKIILPDMNPKSIDTICGELWALQSLHHTLVSLGYMKVFESLFRPDKPLTIDSNFYDQIFTALLDMKPNNVDQAPAIAFSNLMTKAILKLHEVDKVLCRKKLSKYFSILLPNFVTEKREIAQTTAELFQEVIGICIDDDMINEARTAVTSGISRTDKTYLEKIIATMVSGMRPPYKNSWDLIFGLYGSLFLRLGNASHPLLDELVTALGDLYGTEFQTQQFQDALVKALGAAISAMGPQAFLGLLPLNLEKKNPLERRDWLLPLLKDNTRNTQLRFFADYFLPLSNGLEQKAKKSETSERAVEAKNLMAYYYQIWDIFPGFCLYPSDLADSFKLIAKNLGTLLPQNPKLQPVICTGIIYLIKTASAPPTVKETAQDVEAKVKSLAVFSKNFLPILFNIYGENPSEVVLQLISEYASITEPQLLNTFFKNVVSKLLTAASSQDAMDEKKTAQTKAYLTDLVLAFVKYLDKENLDFLFKVIKPQLEDPVPTVQKKSFKVLKEVLEHHSQFVMDNFNELQTLLTSALLTSTPSAKKSRLNCLLYLIKHLNASNIKNIPSVVADVILCTKEANAKARASATLVLQTMGEKMAATVGIKEFFSMVIAGLGGTSSHMIAATITALASLIEEFAPSLDIAFIQQLLVPIVKLFETTNREIMKAIFPFIKVVFSKFDTEALKPNVQTIMATLSSFSNDNKHHFREEIRHTFEKLIKKYGFEYVNSFVSESDAKLAAHINKALRAKKNKKNKEKQEQNPTQKDINHSDSEDGDITQEKKVKADSGTWLMESDDPMDFLDARSLKNVIASKPKTQESSKKKSSTPTFEVDESGKLIIDEEGLQKRKRKSVDDDFMDILEDQAERYDNKKIAAAKRKRLREEQEEEEEQGAKTTSMEEGEEETESKSSTLNSAAQRPAKKRKGKDGQGVHLGEEYRSKKAKGDMKKPGKPDPYAYLPLNPRMLNRRSKNKAVSQFKKVVEAAKKGANQAKPTKKRKV